MIDHDIVKEMVGKTNGKDHQGIMDCGNALTWERIS